MGYHVDSTRKKLAPEFSRMENEYKRYPAFHMRVVPAAGTNTAVFFP